MVDNIKIINPLPSLSSTIRVKPAGQRQNNKQQDLFKEAFKKRQKKKKKHPMRVKISGRGATAGSAKHTRYAVTIKKSKKSSPKRVIDIRV